MWNLLGSESILYWKEIIYNCCKLINFKWISVLLFFRKISEIKHIQRGLREKYVIKRGDERGQKIWLKVQRSYDVCSFHQNLSRIQEQFFSCKNSEFLQPKMTILQWKIFHNKKKHSQKFHYRKFHNLNVV